MGAAGHEAAALRHSEVGLLLVRRSLPARPGDGEDRVGEAVADVEPVRLDRGQALGGDVANRVAEVHGLVEGVVVHQHVEDAPNVRPAIGVAVAVGKRELGVLLALGVEALHRERRRAAVVAAEAGAGEVGIHDLSEHDVMEHHVVGWDDVPRGVDDVRAHSNDVAVDLRRVRPLRCLDDAEGAHLDGARAVDERLDRAERAGRDRERGDGGEHEDAAEAHEPTVTAAIRAVLRR